MTGPLWSLLDNAAGRALRPTPQTRSSFPPSSLKLTCMCQVWETRGYVELWVCSGVRIHSARGLFPVTAGRLQVEVHLNRAQQCFFLLHLYFSCSERSGVIVGLPTDTLSNMAPHPQLDCVCCFTWWVNDCLNESHSLIWCQFCVVLSLLHVYTWDLHGFTFVSPCLLQNMPPNVWFDCILSWWAENKPKIFDRGVLFVIFLMSCSSVCVFVYSRCFFLNLTVIQAKKNQSLLF